MKRTIYPFVLVFLFLSACSPTPHPTELPVPLSETPSPRPSETATPEPFTTPIPKVTLIPTSTSTTHPTPNYAQIRLVRTYAIYQLSSQVVLDTGSLKGEYEAVGRRIRMTNIDFRCVFSRQVPTELECKGPAIPFGQSIYFILYKAGTDEIVYENILIFTGPIPSPTGISCEIEPLWPSNQGDFGCFAATCYQSHEWFGGTGNTCTTPWPYEWKYTYP